MDWPFPARPLVAASINNPDDLRRVASLDWSDPPCDVLEWRLDGLQGVARTDLAAAIAACPLPALLTARRLDEGGFASWPDEATRLTTATAFLAPGRLLDIEARSLESDAAWRELAAHADDEGVPVVVSWHDFLGLPPEGAVRRAQNAALANKASVVKVAATARTLDDVLSLASVFRLAAPLPVSLMAMGRFGLSSRLLFAQAGSVLNYGFLFEASVPGQWPARELKRMLG